MAAPFFAVRKVNGEYQTQGVAHCSLGHRIPAHNSDKTDGIFAEWNWDGSKLTVTNDRYGFFILYYFASDNEFIISPSLIQVVAHGAPTAFDDAALAVFLRLSFFLSDDTPFKAIRLVPPDTSFYWSDGKLSVTGRFTSSKFQNLKRDEVIDTYIALFRSSIERRLQNSGKTAVPLSGGRDSRHILLELCRAGHPPDITATLRHLPPRSNGDAESAAQLTAALKIQHTILDQPKSRLSPELRKNVDTNFSTFEHGWIMPMADFLNGRVESAYDGVAGDVLSAGHFLDEELVNLYEAGNLPGLADYLLTFDNPERALQLLLTAKRYKELSYELAKSHLIKELEKHAEQVNPTTSFFFWNRTRRVANLNNGLFSSVSNVYSPFIDHEVFDFMTSQPASMYLDYQLHTDAIARAHPQFAHVPYEKKDYSRINHNHFRKFTLEVSRYHLTQRSLSLRDSFLLSRLLANLALGRGGITWLSSLSIYFAQLDHLANGGKPDSY
ncbi:MAG TPA: asparagine synthase-related protein [Pyrinomonadaceae bacterium]|jgi:asparagine synthase (glutamine-hydrolysing)|nr:asparagine synthase-related protein [Pyrinomonadaceae bacterium]